MPIVLFILDAGLVVPVGSLLRDALAPFEPMLATQRPCPFGHALCSDEDPCSGHERWKQVRDAYAEFLNSTTLQDVSTTKQKKKHRTR